MSRQAARRAVPQDAPQNRVMNDAQKANHIREVVLQAGVDLRARHTWLRHQDAIGMGLMLVSIAGMALSAWLYMQGAIAWWLCIPVTAVLASITHELEHDLIHQMYFRQRPWVNHLMLILAWLARPNSINPFIRRNIHLHHHKFSGQESDLEERGITNGVRWTPLRIVMLVDNAIGLLMRHNEINLVSKLYVEKQKVDSNFQRLVYKYQKFLAFSFIGWLYYPFMYAWVVWHGLQAAMPALGLAWAPSEATQSFMHGLDLYAVVYLLPNTLRGFCLFFISSNMHYYGDIEERNTMQQCQVLNVWWLWPMQAFCFNFGSTHAIHHFAVKEPFYVRQWTAGTAHQVMREMGVRFNDLGTFRRDNRYNEWATKGA
jgi:fatty acid desaturase